MGEQPSTHQPVTYDRCAHVEGPFYHGTKSALGAGAELVPGYGSNFQQNRVSNNIYFTALVESAAWGSGAGDRAGRSGVRGHIYVVDPSARSRTTTNVTNKRVPGNKSRAKQVCPKAMSMRRMSHMVHA